MIEAGKYHCYGNDFLVVGPGQVAAGELSALSRAICDPHFGVGADGCVFVSERGPAGAFGFRIFNRDGSEAGMSGNGARCAAAFLLQGRQAAGPEVVLEADSGRKRFFLLDQGEERWTFRSLMGTPRFAPDLIPFAAPEGLTSVEDYPLEAAGVTVRIHALSVGNPQCAVFPSGALGDDEFQRLGPALENHPRFPQRTNVSFVQVTGPNGLRIRIWERGVGETHSSGTGACGAAVAAIRAGLASSPVTVQTETGRQTVEWVPGQEMALTGAAEFIAELKFFWRSRQENESGPRKTSS